MIKYKNLTLIGTSHIALESVQEVERIISKIKPEVVALELDSARFRALMSNEKRKLHFSGIFRVGIKGYIFSLIGAYVEKKLGDIVGVSPGDEMKQAAYSARNIGAKIAMIDQSIEITLKKFSKHLTWKEKFRFLEDIIMAIIKRPKINIDLKKVPDKKIIHDMITQVKKRYPNVYRVLIEDRNKIMAKNLYRLTQDYNVVAVVGAGHEEEIIGEIKCLEEKSQLQF